MWKIKLLLLSIVVLSACDREDAIVYDGNYTGTLDYTYSAYIDHVPINETFSTPNVIMVKMKSGSLVEVSGHAKLNAAIQKINQPLELNRSHILNLEFKEEGIRRCLFVKFDTAMNAIKIEYEEVVDADLSTELIRFDGKK